MIKSLMALGHSEVSADGRTVTSEVETRQALRDGDDYEKIEAMRYLIAALPNQSRFDRLLPEVVKIVGNANLELKPTTSVDEQAKNERAILLLTVNALQKDSINKNHVIRGWALKAMGSLHLSEVVPSLTEAVRRGAADSSPFVRQIAVQSVPKLAELDCSLVGNIVEGVLIKLLHDIEMTVVGSALQSLFRIFQMYPFLLTINQNEFNQLQSTFGFSSSTTPVLSLFHPYFLKLVSESLVHIPPLCQSPAIHLLTFYSRTFFTSSSNSPHFSLFIIKLKDLLQHTSSLSVAIACSRSLLLLSSNSEDVYPSVSCIDIHHHRIIPCLFHWLCLSDVSAGGECLLDIVQIIAQKKPESIVSYSKHLLIRFGDSGSLKRKKLEILHSMASFSDFPFDLVVEHLFIAVHWNVKHVDGFGCANILQFLVLIVLKRIESMENEASSQILKTCTQNLIQLVTESDSLILIDEAIKCLGQVTTTSNHRMDTSHLDTIALHIAQRIAIDLTTTTTPTTTEAISKGRSAMIRLLTTHHEHTPNIILDVFRVLIEAVGLQHPSIEFEEVQFEILNLGAHLWSYYYPKNVSDDSKQLFSRLDGLWKCLLFHFSKDMRGIRIRETARLMSQLTTTTHQGQTINTIEPFLIAFKKKANTSSLSKIDTHAAAANEDEEKLIHSIGTIGGMLHKKMRGVNEIIPFISETDLQRGRRQLVLDSTRLPKYDDTTEKSISSQRSAPDDDDLDKFYRVTQHDARLALGSKVIDSNDPMAVLFGSTTTTTTTTLQRGVIVFGEEEDTSESEAAETQQTNKDILQIAHHNKDDDDEEADWAQIHQQYNF